MTDPAVAAGSAVRVRFCPSPTGNPHVGMVRTALFNWAYARHTGGTFVFRIEDTDSARDSEQSYEDLLEALRWLHLDWDEGPEVGGPYEPYRQSQRLEVYTDVARRLLEAGLAYESYSTSEEIAARRRAAGQGPELGYDNADRDLTDEEKQRRRDAGESPVLRLRMPDEDLGWHDLVRKGDKDGRIVFAAGSVPDFVIVRGNGEPLYTLVNPVDDALMGITHVLRGEDLLSSTPRQIAMYRALREIGVTDRDEPVFGHLPYVMGEGNKKLSKRDPQSSLNHYRDEGFLPEGLVNYLALLGWSIGEDREFFSLAEMAGAFDVADVNASPARFDYKKALAINADWVRALTADELAARLVPFLQRDGVLPAEPSAAQLAMLDAAVPLVQERMELLGQATGMLGFLFADDGPGSAPFTPDPDAVASVLTPEARPTLQAAHDALALLPEWSTPQIEAALRGALVEGLGLKPKLAFGPVRVAVSGRRVSPPLFESLELLGRDRSLARLTAALGA